MFIIHKLQTYNAFEAQIVFGNPASAESWNSVQPLSYFPPEINDFKWKLMTGVSTVVCIKLWKDGLLLHFNVKKRIHFIFK